MQNVRALLPQALILLFCGVPWPPPCVLCAIHLSPREDLSSSTSSQELRDFQWHSHCNAGNVQGREEWIRGTSTYFAFCKDCGGGSWVF